eukprot:scaffold314006_cov28-Tisochrysis_lutea.AAC.1
MKWVGNQSCQGSRASSKASSRCASRPSSGPSRRSRPASGRHAKEQGSCATAPFGGLPTSPQTVSATPPIISNGSIPSPPNMDGVRAAVLELNELAGAGSSIVKREDGSHGLQTKALPLVFWRDGLQVDNGPLRAYGAPDCAAFLRDLLDGYFPYELKHAFPDGVPFGVTDRTDRWHAEGEPVVWGYGRVLDSRGESRVMQLGVPGGNSVDAVHLKNNTQSATEFAGRGGRDEIRHKLERQERAAAFARAAEARWAKAST